VVLPELVRRSAEKVLTEYCEEGVPYCARHQVDLRFELEGTALTLFLVEAAVPGTGPPRETSLARFRFSSGLGQWTLHYPDAERRWIFYLNATPTLDLRQLIHALDQDPFGLFWP
jgi:hypothetical protein